MSPKRKKGKREAWARTEKRHFGLCRNLRKIVAKEMDFYANFSFKIMYKNLSTVFLWEKLKWKSFEIVKKSFPCQSSPSFPVASLKPSNLLQTFLLLSFFTFLI